MSARKEPHFFSHAELNWDVPDGAPQARAVADLRTYEKFFSKTDAPVRGESSTTYLWSAKAASRIAEYSESARIVAIVRNPIDRAFSHYLHNLRRGSQTNDLGAIFRCLRTAPLESDGRTSISRAGSMPMGSRDFRNTSPIESACSFSKSSLRVPGNT
jgi:hypothetical protein